MNNIPKKQSSAILLKSIFERKIFIIVTTIIFVIIALIIMLPQNKLYKSEAILAIGKYRNLKNHLVYLEDAKQLSVRLLSTYPSLIRVESKGNGYIIIQDSGETAAKTQARLNEILEKLLSYHNKRYKSVREFYKKKLDYYLDQKKLINTSISKYFIPLKKQDKVSEERSLIAYFLFLEQFKSFGNRLDQLEDMIFQYDQALLFDFQPTHIIEQPTLPLNPNRPKLLKYTLLSIVLGFLVGLFGAFCLAYRDYILSLFKNSGSDHSE